MKHTDHVLLRTRTGEGIWLDLVTPIRDNTMPAWLEALLLPHRRGDDDLWTALLILGECCYEWHSHWGSATDVNGVELFISEPRSFRKAWSVVPVAKKLGVECGYAGYCFVLAPNGTWSHE